MELRADRLLLRRQEAADALGLSIDTVARLIASGELNVVRIGSSVRVPRDDVARLIDRGGAPTTQRRAS